MIEAGCESAVFPFEPGARMPRLRARASLAVGRHSDALNALKEGRKQGPERALLEAAALSGLFRHREALGVASRALRRRPLDPDMVARLRIVRGHALWTLGRSGQGRADVQKGLAGAAADLTRARAYEALALFAWKEADPEAARRELAAAWRLYGASGCSVGLVRTLEKQGGVLRDEGRFEEALRAQTRRIEIASTTTRLDLMAHAHTDRGDLLAYDG